MTSPSASGPCMRRSNGATSSSPTASGGSYGVLRCSPEVPARGGRRRGRRRSRDAPVAGGEEPRPPLRRPILDARDDPRVRAQSARGSRAKKMSLGALTRSTTFASREAIDAEIRGPTQEVLLEQLDRELANMRVSLSWFLDHAPERRSRSPFFSIHLDGAGVSARRCPLVRRSLRKGFDGGARSAGERSAGGGRHRPNAWGRVAGADALRRKLEPRESWPEAGNCRRTAQSWSRTGKPCDLRGGRGRDRNRGRAAPPRWEGPRGRRLHASASSLRTSRFDQATSRKHLGAGSITPQPWRLRASRRKIERSGRPLPG